MAGGREEAKTFLESGTAGFSRAQLSGPYGPGDLEEIIQAVRDKVPPRSSISPKEKARLLVSRSSCGCKVSPLC